MSEKISHKNSLDPTSEEALVKLESLIQYERALQERIKNVNKKSLPLAFMGTILVGMVALALCPFAQHPPFFNLSATIIWTLFFSIIGFSIVYQLAFHYWDQDLIPEARRRGQYWAETLFNNRFFRAKSVYYHRDDIFPLNHDYYTNISFRHHPSNIHHNHHD